jgi:tRNA-specific 2-thiouridylase
VVDLDAHDRRVVVGPHRALARDRVHVSRVNWLDAPPAGEAGRAVQVKLRSAQAPAPATVFAGADGTAEIVLEDPQHGIAPGQAAVFYDASRLIGGGWITGAALAQAA